MKNKPSADFFNRWQRFEKLLRRQVAKPNEKQLTVRCWKASTLSSTIRLLVKRERAYLRTTFPSAKKIILRLVSLGWLRPVKITTEKPRLRLFLMETDVAGNKSVDPLELLQASLPHGVISYFAALEYHDLTKQVPPFYHIGRLLAGQPTEPPKKPVLASQVSVKRNPLGTELFQFGEATYYETKRYRVLTPGVQLRTVGPRTWLRITTLEQTLLDTLLQPIRCGGEAVIFEAWDRARDNFDATRMADHLAKIRRDELSRRTGAILDLIGIKVAKTPLGDLLRLVKKRMTAATPEIPLLPNMDFTSRSDAWRIRVP
jgi:predicted transcriptional regulator of viral defense system